MQSIRCPKKHLWPTYNIPEIMHQSCFNGRYTGTADIRVKTGHMLDIPSNIWLLKHFIRKITICVAKYTL